MNAVDTVLAAYDMQKLASGTESPKLTYKRWAALVHPDHCTDPRAADAFVRLGELLKGPITTDFHLKSRVVQTWKKRPRSQYVDYEVVGDEHAFVRVYREPKLRQDLEKEVDAFKKVDLWTPAVLDVGRIRAKGNRHLPLAYMSIDPTAGVLAEASTFVPGLPMQHAGWVMRRLLALSARCIEAGLSPLISGETILLGPTTRAAILYEYRKGNTVESLCDLMFTSMLGSSSNTRAFLRGCKISKKDPNILLDEFNELLQKMFGPRKYEPFTGSYAAYLGE